MVLFNNEKLQVEFDLIEEDLEELQPQIREVRADIENLEVLLNRRGFCIAISVFSHSSREYLAGDDGDFIQINEYVEWHRLKNKWRLTLHKEQANGCLAINSEPYLASTIEEIPLLQASEAEQLRASHVLGEFAREVGLKLKAHKRRNLDLNEDSQNESIKYIEAEQD